jgi:hypothetical protein
MADEGEVHSVFVFYSKYSQACRQMLGWWNREGVDERAVKLVCVDAPSWRPLLADHIPLVPAIWCLYADGGIKRLTSLHHVWGALHSLGCITRPLFIGCPPGTSQAHLPHQVEPQQPDQQQQRPPGRTLLPGTTAAAAAVATTAIPTYRDREGFSVNPSPPPGPPFHPPAPTYMPAPATDQHTTTAHHAEPYAPSTMVTDLVGMGGGGSSMSTKGIKKPSIMEAAMAMKTEYEAHLKTGGPGDRDRGTMAVGAHHH